MKNFLRLLAVAIVVSLPSDSYFLSKLLALCKHSSLDNAKSSYRLPPTTSFLLIRHLFYWLEAFQYLKMLAVFLVISIKNWMANGMKDLLLLQWAVRIRFPFDCFQNNSRLVNRIGWSYFRIWGWNWPLEKKNLIVYLESGYSSSQFPIPFKYVVPIFDFSCELSLPILLRILYLSFPHLFSCVPNVKTILLRWISCR